MMLNKLKQYFYLFLILVVIYFSNYYLMKNNLISSNYFWLFSIITLAIFSVIQVVNSENWVEHIFGYVLFIYATVSLFKNEYKISWQHYLFFLTSFVLLNKNLYTIILTKIESLTSISKDGAKFGENQPPNREPSNLSTNQNNSPQTLSAQRYILPYSSYSYFVAKVSRDSIDGRPFSVLAKLIFTFQFIITIFTELNQNNSKNEPSWKLPSDLVKLCIEQLIHSENKLHPDSFSYAYTYLDKMRLFFEEVDFFWKKSPLYNPEVTYYVKDYLNNEWLLIADPLLQKKVQISKFISPEALESFVKFGIICFTDLNLKNAN